MPQILGVAALAALFAALLFAHAAPLAGMVDLWDNSPMYSFGYVVPLISLYLIWTQREVLRGVPTRPSYPLGLPALALGLAMLVVGHLGGIQVVAQLAFLVSLVACVLLVFGHAWFRVTWVAFAYLLLMVPIWDAFTEPLHFPFQQLSAAIGIRMLQALGIPAYGEGVLIVLPNITLEVARACSGVNYLVAVLALGVPLAYLCLPTMWRRVALIVTAVVVAAFSNSLRVALIGVLSYLDIGSPLHGPAHVLHGLFVSGIGYVALFLGLRVLTPKQDPSAAAQTAATALPAWPAPSRAHSAALATTFALVGWFLASHVPQPVPLKGDLDQLPIQLGRWRGAASPAVAVDPWSDADQRIRRRYRATEGGDLDVLIAYYGAQHQGKEVASHRSDAWHRSSSVETIALPGGMKLEANLKGSPEGGGERLALFWYDIDGTPAASQIAAKLGTLWNSVARNRTNGAVVVISTDVPAGADREGRIAAMTELASEVHAALEKLLRGAGRHAS